MPSTGQAGAWQNARHAGTMLGAARRSGRVGLPDTFDGRTIGAGRGAVMQSTRPKGWLAWRVPLVAAGLLIVPVIIDMTRSDPKALYQPQSDQSSASVSETDLSLIHEAVVRYQVANLSPKDLAPAAAAKLGGYCLGLGKSGGTDPPASLVASLKDLPLPMIPYTQCVKEGMRGRIPIWVVSVSSIGADTAQAVGRSVQNSYVYSLERRQGGWVVTAAKLTGRSIARANLLGSGPSGSPPHAPANGHGHPRYARIGDDDASGLALRAAGRTSPESGLDLSLAARSTVICADGVVRAARLA